MSRPRKNKFPGWLPGLYRKVGKTRDLYYCLTPQYLSLGSDLPTARRKLVEMQSGQMVARTISTLLEEFIVHREDLSRRDGRPAALTIEGNRVEAEVLKKFFGHMRLQDLSTNHVWQYLHQERGKEAPIRANREISLLSTAFRYAVNRGLTATNPCSGVEKNRERPRDRSVSLPELESFCEFATRNGHHSAASSKLTVCTGPVVAAAAMLSFLTSKAESQILGLKIDKVTESGIQFEGRKGGFGTLVEWTPALQKVIDDLAKLRRNGAAVHVVLNDDGHPYTLSGFISVWRPVMQAWVADAPPGETRLAFTFHDLRAMSITYLKTMGRDVKELSGHTTDAVPNRVYDRRRVRIAKAVL